mgnify:CR=1 FL=1
MLKISIFKYFRVSGIRHFYNSHNRGKTMRRVSLFTAVIEQYLFSGLILGWASLVYIMKEEHFYSDLCQNDISSRIKVLNGTCSNTCPEQDAKFNVRITKFFTSENFLGQKCIILRQNGFKIILKNKSRVSGDNFQKILTSKFGDQKKTNGIQNFGV